MADFGGKREQNNEYLENVRSSAAMQLMENIPGGFFIYRADETEEIISINNSLVKLLGCSSKEEFMEYTGGTFKGLVHEEDYQDVEASIRAQIKDRDKASDYVEYRIRRKNGTILWVQDYGQYVKTSDEGAVFYVFVFDSTSKHLEEVEQKKQLTIEQNRYKGALVRGAAFYFEFDVTDGYIRDEFVIQDEYKSFFSSQKTLPVSYEEYYANMIKESSLQLLDDHDAVYWTCEGLIDAYRSGKPIVEFEYYSRKTRLYWNAEILLSAGLSDDSVHAVYVCRDVTKRHQKLNRDYAYQKTLMKFMESYADGASIIDLETGEMDNFVLSEDRLFEGVETWEENTRLYEEFVLDGFKEDYTLNMSIDNIRNNLIESDKYSFPVIYVDKDGNQTRMINSFYKIDDELKYVLALYQDTTKEYEHENHIERIKGEALALGKPDSVDVKNAMSSGKKRKILVVEDNASNREIITMLLKDTFEVLTAADGEEGFAVLKENYRELSLIILDVFMPVCDGFQFLMMMNKEPRLMQVPVLVATSSDKREDEELCLKLGAADFINKPYNPDALRGRVNNIIHLNESISTLMVVEFDKITGLYTLSAFYHHAAKLLESHAEDFDLVVIDIQEFAVLNSIYGEKICDDILIYTASVLKNKFPKALMARQDDLFYLLSPSEYRMGEEHIVEYCNSVSENGPVPNVRVRVGIYANVDKEQSVSVLCDRAKLAVNSVENDKFSTVAYYSQEFEKKRIDDQKLLRAFDRAIEGHEFVIWLQPKVEVNTGKLAGAEALVRWIDNEGNFISPGMFIPLFEREGLIRTLDEYIFRAVCEYQKSIISRGETPVPLSINLSRNSLFSDGIVETYSNIAKEEGVDLALVPIEITESAATSELMIVDICNSFVDAGFSLHMDDFGTGYSSLSSLAMLPFSVIKLDKLLIDRMETDKGSIVVKNVIEIAHDLNMKVVAEGVEEKHQVDFLGSISCDIIQGYYYSKPLRIEEFEKLKDQIWE